jgi:CheY-like chemotaxis protein
MSKNHPKNLFAQRFRVVLVGDDERFTYALGELLQSAGLSVVVANTAAQALFELDRPGRRVLLCDLAAVHLQGVETVVALRNSRTAVPTVAISSMPNIVQHCAALGIRHHLAQPFRFGQLMDLLELAARPSVSATTYAAVSATLAE